MTIPSVLVLALLGTQAPATVPPASEQIAAAVLAAPEEQRGDATVLGYGTDGKLTTLRTGTGNLICLAHDPAEKAFSVACYQKDLEPFMARGRELRAQGITGKDRDQKRWAEADAGTLHMPKEPRTLYILSGTAFDPVSGAVTDGYERFVIYCPYATAQSTGLSTMPVPGGPWIMFPGTAGAHIMINPPKPAKGSK